MMWNMRILALALGTFAAVTPAVGLLTPAHAQRDQTLVVAAASDLQAMNPLVATEANTADVLRHLLFLPLLRYDAQSRLAPSLAQSWQVIGDTAVVFRLRRDVRWHDGRLTTARDVVFTFRTARNAATAFPAAGDLEHWTDAVVLDSFTVRLRFVPHADPLDVWATLPVVPEHLLAGIQPAQLRNAAFNRAPVGNGPFRFGSHRANDRWVFEANPDFPRALGGPPRLARIIWRVIPDRAAQITALLTGQVHVVLSPGAEQVRELGARTDFRGVVKPSRRYYFINWNGQHAALSDPRVRRALMLGLNRQQQIDVLRAGYAQVATAPIAPYHWAFDAQLAPLPYDPGAARALLAEAGYRDRNGDGVVEAADGRRLEIELKVPANSAFNRDLGELIRADLARIGVAVRVRPVDFATLVDDVSSPDRRFDAALLAFETELRLSLRETFHTAALGGPYQSSSYSNPRVDHLLDAVDRTTDRDAAARIWAELQAILVEDQPWGVLWYPPELLLAHERLRGFAPDIRGLFADAAAWHFAQPTARGAGRFTTSR